MKAKLKAFTLIELLIVVAIIAILAAIAVPNFLEARVRSQVSRVKADQRTYATAIESYYVDWNSYPCTIDALVTPEKCVNPITNGLILEAWMYGLSSPVAYLSSAVIQEPFNARQGDALFEGCDIVNNGPACGDKSNRTPVYGYVALPNDDLISFFMPVLMNLISSMIPSITVGPDTVASIVRKRWGLISPGPDTYFSYDRCLIEQPGAGPQCLFNQVADAFIDSVNGIYDPTNGTISRGEIVRSMEGIQ